jgi:predicted nucleic-acid-binding protein
VIAFDTNVLLRILLQDEPRQASRAQAQLRQCLEEQETCLLTDIVLCELDWVLRRSYRASRADVLAVLDHLAGRAPFGFQDRDLVRQVIEAFRHGRGEFADLLLGLRGRADGAATTYTFDRELRRIESFTVLDS